MKLSRNLLSRILAALPVAGLFIAGMVARGDLVDWLQNLEANGRFEVAFFRTVALPGGPLTVRRLPAESRHILDDLVSKSPNDAELYLMRARADEAQLDFTTAEADWQKFAQVANDKVDAQLQLADFYHRRLRPLDEIKALAAAAQAPSPAADKLLPPNQQRAWQTFDRVFEVLDLEPMIAEKPDAVAIPNGPATIEFEHVNFSYPRAEEVSLASLESVAVLDQAPSQQVLFDVSFTAMSGQLVALVGPSGGGKTTMSHLIPRLYDVRSGAIRINGVDLRDATLASIRREIGVVTQDAHLFHDTIKANLQYAKPDASDRELDEALRAAQIMPLIESLPAGLDTVVGDRGYRLSGGEKQRIAIARLLLKAPAIVVLDEATAHLDSESELAVQLALHTALAGRTSVVIAHRLSTVREADQILVVVEGRIVERGTHSDLLAAEGVYEELYRTQFSRQGATEPGIPDVSLAAD